jgi:hypothetical protein
MKNSLIFFIILLQLVTKKDAFGQSLANGIQSVLPPSPNAASLGKFLETPVSNFTGIPKINIPIYEIKEGDIKLPVLLSYHSGGIKVDEVASSEGLGWSLVAGGSITRSTRGLPDDQSRINTVQLNKYLNNQMTATEEMAYRHFNR